VVDEFSVGFVVVAVAAADVGCAVMGLRLVAAVVLGRFVVLRATDVDLTVVELVLLLMLLDFVGFAVVAAGVVFMLIVELVFSSDSTEKVVTSRSSADNVVGSTLTIKLVGVGFGRGAFVVST
jgi:hypothetical protein